MATREINLSGGETTILKAIGIGGAPAYGKLLLAQLEELEDAEILDELQGLISLGYVLSDKVNLYTRDDIERSVFRVNASYARDLKDAIFPGRRRDPERRRRRRG
ncbi:MAG: hypothetical protein ABI925_07385 [Verrucomicrobiota bacterium]